MRTRRRWTPTPYRESTGARVDLPAAQTSVFTLTAGPLPPNPPGILTRPDVPACLDQLRRHFRWVLIDTPPITPDYLEGYLSSMVRASDGCVLVLDLGDDDGPFGAEAVVERLAQVKTVLIGEIPTDPDDPTRAVTVPGREANEIPCRTGLPAS